MEYVLCTTLSSFKLAIWYIHDIKLASNSNIFVYTALSTYRIFTLLSIALVSWLFNPEDTVWIVHRRAQIIWIAGVFVWSMLIRYLLRRDFFGASSKKLLLLSGELEASLIQKAWRRVPHRQNLFLIDGDHLDFLLHKNQESCLLAIGENRENFNINVGLIEKIEMLEPRRIQATSPLGLLKANKNGSSFFVDR